MLIVIGTVHVYIFCIPTCHWTCPYMPVCAYLHVLHDSKPSRYVVYGLPMAPGNFS